MLRLWWRPEGGTRSPKESGLTAAYIDQKGRPRRGTSIIYSSMTCYITLGLSTSRRISVPLGCERSVKFTGGPLLHFRSRCPCLE
uniref:Uncharacterized protein n=1 Tax=Solanum lycopersicum TaxID=4081 RepID=A0A3Q7HRK1_SOLLC